MKTLKFGISFLLTSLIGMSFSQKNRALDSVIFSHSMNFAESSLSSSGDFFAGLLQDSKTLLVAKNEAGDYPLSENINFKNGEGAFRPVGYPQDQYVYYTFFDVSSVIQSPVRIHPKSRTIKKRRKSYRDIRMSSFMNGDPLINSSRNTYQTQLALATSNNYYEDRITPLRAVEFRYSNQPSFIFAQYDQVICFSQGVEKVSIINITGDLLSTSEVITTKPLISSNKGRTILLDKITGNFYMVVETNFSYNFYEVDVNSGKTKYLFKTETVWPEPNWELNNGVLNYERTFENNKVRLSRNINE